MSLVAFDRTLLSLVGFALLAALSATGCTKQLPPAATPEPIAPRVAAPAPEPGQGRLVVDVVEGPTQVERVWMAAAQVEDGQGRVSLQFYEDSEPLCAASPCVLDVPAGSNVLLGFPVLDSGGREVELVHVDRGTTVYRRSLTRHRKQGGLGVLGIVSTSLGGMAMITGAALLPVGLSKDSDGIVTAGGISAGVGALAVAFGIWAMRHDSAIYRPGSSIHFSLP